MLKSDPRFLRVLDALMAPFTIVGALLLRLQRIVPLTSAPIARAVYRRTGVFPLRDHYYEPGFLAAAGDALGPERRLPGIDFGMTKQLALLRQFDVARELSQFPIADPGDGARTYYYENPSFRSGDAECLYAVLRHFKPKRMIEIGSGFSTLIAAAALARNGSEGSAPCQHVCIEPYSFGWLDDVRDISVIRQRVEDVGEGLFRQLSHGDVLFIDSSHMIRPGGDVLFEYLELLPSLNDGVLVHVHDIFTPYDYPREWLVEDGRLWNEQYLLEAFLNFNSHFEVVLALNLLARQRPEEVAAAFPIYGAQGGQRPLGSLWLQRVSPGDTAARRR